MIGEIEGIKIYVNDGTYTKYKKTLEDEIDELQQENKQLKDNWNKLKEFIAKEYYMYLPLEATAKSITILIDKMQELEGSDSK